MIDLVFADWDDIEQQSCPDFSLIVPGWGDGECAIGQYAISHIIKTLKPCKLGRGYSKYFKGASAVDVEQGFKGKWNYTCEVWMSVEKKLYLLSYKLPVKQDMKEEFIVKLLEFISRMEFERVIYLTCLPNTQLPKDSSFVPKLFAWSESRAMFSLIEDRIVGSPFSTFANHTNFPVKIDPSTLEGLTKMFITKSMEQEEDEDEEYSNFVTPVIVLAKWCDDTLVDLKPAVELALAAFKFLKYPRTDWAVRNLKNLPTDLRIEDFLCELPLPSNNSQ